MYVAEYQSARYAAAAAGWWAPIGRGTCWGSADVAGIRTPTGHWSRTGTAIWRCVNLVTVYPHTASTLAPYLGSFIEVRIGMDETTPLSNDLSVAGERSHPLVWEGLILSLHYSLNLWSRWSLRGRGKCGVGGV